jgi:diguanylate cyclase (GGDEF)-like protein
MEAAGPSAQPPHGGRPATRVAIVGGSARAAGVARLLEHMRGASIVSICALSTQPAGRFAQEAGIPLVADPLFVLSTAPAPDIVIDLSEDVVTRTALESALPPSTELLGGAAADVISGTLGGDAAVADGFDSGRPELPLAHGEAEVAGQIRRLKASNDALARTNRDLETRLAEVYFMHEFVKSLVAYHRTEDVSSVIVDACAGILGADVAAVYLLDRETWSLHLARSQGRPIGSVPSVVALSDGFLGRAFSEGFALEEDISRERSDSMWLAASAMRPETLAAASLSAGGEPIGVLALGWSLAKHFEAAEVERLRVVADQSALALQNALLHAELEQLSVTDRLTELFNHGYLTMRLDQELGRAGRFGHTLSVIMLDIDNFKAFNDRFGHLAGDEVLRGVSALVRENLREMDVAARYGGEEFVVIVPETDTAGARAVAERIRQSIAAHVFVRDEAGGEVHATISVGVSTFPADGRSVESLIRAADDAMYGAKRAGKDRVVTARSMQD